MKNQNLFNAVEQVCDHLPTGAELIQLISAHEKDIETDLGNRSKSSTRDSIREIVVKALSGAKDVTTVIDELLDLHPGIITKPQTDSLLDLNKDGYVDIAFEPEKSDTYLVKTSEGLYDFAEFKNVSWYHGILTGGAPVLWRNIPVTNAVQSFHKEVVPRVMVEDEYTPKLPATHKLRDDYTYNCSSCDSLNTPNAYAVEAVIKGGTIIHTCTSCDERKRLTF